MAWDDVLGNSAPADDYDPQTFINDYISEQAQGRTPQIDIDQNLQATRLARRLKQGLATKPPPDAKKPGEDLSSFGSSEQPEVGDLSQFGEAPKEEAPKPKEEGKGLLAGAAEAVGGMATTAGKVGTEALITSTGKTLKGTALAAGPKPTPPETPTWIDDLSGVKDKSDSERVALMRRAVRELPRGMAIDYNAALRRIQDGADPETEIAQLRKSHAAWEKMAATPKEQPLYQAGQTVEDLAKKLEVTPEERESMTGRVSGAIGGALPAVAATLGGAAVGAPWTGIAIGAAQMGAQSAGATFDRATAAGADVDTAAKAAGLDAIIGGGLGVLPLGMILRPVQQSAPGLTGWAAAKLNQAVRSGLTFATIGEAQHYLGEQVAAHFYDPKAHYEWDTKRAVASMIAGGVFGVLHPLHKPETPPPPRPDLPPPRPDETPPPRPEDEPPPRPDETGPNRERTWKPEGPAATGKRADLMRDILGNYYGFRSADIDGMSLTELAAGIKMADAFWDFHTKQGMKLDEVKDLIKGKPWEDFTVAFDKTVGEQRRADAAAGAPPPPPPGAGTPPPGAQPPPPGAQPPPGAPPGAEAPGAKHGAETGTETAPPPPGPERDAYWSKKAQGAVGDAEDLSVLRKYGFADDEISAMSRDRVREAVDEARKEGIEPDPIPGKREAPVEPKTAEDVRAAEDVINKDHTPDQGEANNIQRGHMKWPPETPDHLELTLEAGKGGVRRGVNPKTGEPFETTVGAAYGYIKGVPMGADGQHPDLFMGDNPTSPMVTVLDEKGPGGGFRQTKSFVGFNSPMEAVAAYLGTSSKTREMIGGVKVMPVSDFVELAKSGGLAKPVSAEMEGARKETKAEAAAPEPAAAPPEQEFTPEQRRSIIEGSHAHLARFEAGAADERHPLETRQHYAEQARGLREGIARHEKALAAESAAERPAENLADVGKAGGAIVEGMYDRLWSDLEKGKTDKDPLLQAAQMVRDRGGMKTKDDLRALAQDYAGIERGPTFQADMHALVERHVPPAAESPYQHKGETSYQQWERAQRESEPEPSEAPPELETIEATAEQHQAVEKALEDVGVNPDEVRPVDIARAAEIIAEEGLAPEDAYQVAVTRAALEDGVITPEEVEQWHGPETAKAVLEPERAPERGVQTEEAGAGAGRAAAEAGEREEAPRPARGGEAGEAEKPVEAAGGAEPDTGREEAAEPSAGGAREEPEPAAAGRKRAPAGGRAKAEPEAAGVPARRVKTDAQVRRERESEAEFAAFEKEGRDLADNLHDALEEAKIPLDSVDEAVENRAIRIMAENGGIHPLNALEAALIQIERENNDVPEQMLLDIGVPQESIDAIDALTPPADRAEAPAAGKRPAEGPQPGEEPVQEGGPAHGAGEERRGAEGAEAEPAEGVRPPEAVEGAGGEREREGAEERPAEVGERDEGVGGRDVDAESGQWWDRDLTSAGRREVLRAAGVKLPARVAWRHISPDNRERLLAERDRGGVEAFGTIKITADDLRPGDRWEGIKNKPIVVESVETVRGRIQAKTNDGVKEFDSFAPLYVQRAEQQKPTPEAKPQQPAEVAPEGYEVDDAKKSSKYEAETFGEYTAVARRLKPWSSERGYGETPEEAQQDALRRVGAKEAHAAAEPVTVDRLKEKLISFASGMSRIGDFTAGAHTRGDAKNHGIGVDAGELSKNAINQLARAVIDWRTRVFVDSGAFGLFRRNLRNRAAIEKELGDLFGKDTTGIVRLEPLDFDKILGTYESIEKAIGDYNGTNGHEIDDTTPEGAIEMEHGGGGRQETNYPRPLFVMPDIVGDQAGSLDLVKQYRDFIKATTDFNLSEPIVPIQRGDLSLAEVYREIVKELGTDKFIVGIPSNEKAVPLAELQKFLNEAKPERIHFLGAVHPKKLEPKLQAVAAAGIDPEHISADANVLRSALYGKLDVPREEGIREVLKTPEIEVEEAAGRQKLIDRLVDGETVRRGNDEWWLAFDPKGGGYVIKHRKDMADTLRVPPDTYRPLEGIWEKEEAAREAADRLEPPKPTKVEKKAPEEVKRGFDEARQDLLLKGATRVGSVDYRIIEGPRDGNFYFTRTEGGIRIEKGGALQQGGWGRERAIEEALEEIKSDLATEEVAHGVPPTVPPSHGEPRPEDVSGTQAERPVGRPPGREGERGEPPVPGPDEGRPEGAGGRGGEPGEAGGGGAGAGDADRVPGGPRAAPGSAGAVKGENYRIEPGALAEERSPKRKALDNIRAIELVREIEAAGRPATAAEQAELARYVGWGGLKGALPDTEGNYGKGLEDVGARLKELLTKDEYRTAQRSIQYAHYTSENVVRAMWAAAERFGFKGGQVFEPGMGVGNFAGLMPAEIAAATHYVGIEFDHTTAKIARLLYPRWGVRQGDFTRAPLPDNMFDLAIGNPPFADIVIKSDPRYSKDNLLLHDYFFAKSLDGVRPGGIMAFISSAGTMNKLDTTARAYLADRADLVGAIRLSSDAFKQNAGTEVTTDIIFLRKRLPGETAGDRAWVDTENVSLPDKTGAMGEVPVNKYFVEHPEMVLGEQGRTDKLYQGRYAVQPRPGQNLAAEIARAVDRLPRDVMKPWEDTFDHAETDFGTAEKKEGTFYVGPTGDLMQMSSGVGRPVARRGAGVEGGITAAGMERIRGLIPIRDALRAVYDADLKEDTKNAAVARERLNESYDGFLKKFGPINKADLQKRRPSSVQQESARAEAREEARYAGMMFHEGSFDPSRMIAEKRPLVEIARARKEARQQATEEYNTGRRYQPWDEGSFDPEEMPDVIIDRRPNIDPFMDDPESYRLRSIEHYDDTNHRAQKGRVFFEPVVFRPKPPEIKSTNDAVLRVLNDMGRLDIPEVASLIGKSEQEVIEELGDRIFKQPGADNRWVTRDEYLSGDVKDKLAAARAAADRDPQYARNVTALEAAQPAPRPPSQIGIKLGSPWLPPATIEAFGKELGLESMSVKYMPEIAQWFVTGDKASAAAVATWGTDRRSAPYLIQDALNQQNPKIYDTFRTADGTRTELNITATQAAQDKVKAIREKFEEWVWADRERSDALAATYNDRYNRLVAREYNGDYLTTPGVVATWKWRPHQTRAVARIIQSGNTYLGHAVGAGKTSEMIGATMEMRRLGLVRKPMIAVPNHMLAQFTKEFYEQYPTARIAVADERRFHTDRRKQFIANVAMEDLDAVVITHSAFGLIPISNEFQDRIIEDELDAYRELLADIPRDQENRVQRGRMEKQIERLEQRLTGKGGKKKDQVFTFEEMGVDFLFVDEAHMFRKLDFATNMAGLKGISPLGSGMAWDLYVKSLYLDEQKPGRSLVLASGTPVTNTMAELYTLSRYLQRAELAKRGLSRFDAWAGQYGETKTELEQNAAGSYDPVTRFRKFVNAADLSVMVRQVMDVVTSRQLDQYVVRPKLKGGERVMNMAEQSRELSAYQNVLAGRMQAIRQRKGPPQKGDDIMLSVINDGRHAAIDMRLVAPDARVNTKSKLDMLVDNVHGIWKDTKRQKFYAVKDGKYDLSKPIDVGPATQMVFVNLGLSGTRGFSVPDYIRAELHRRGIPKSEIAYIYDYKTHVARQRLFNDMNEGKTRVLIGSTAKMATGVNAQRRLYANHNMDPLWYPSDDEQRNGRMVRQGNLNPEVELHDYSTKGTYDSSMWKMMANKAGFIRDFFEGDPNLVEMEDLGEASQYEQAAAVTTADPRLIELTEMKHNLERAWRRKSAFENEVYAIRSRRADARNQAVRMKERIKQTEQDIAQRRDISGDKFKASAGGKAYDKRADLGEALLKLAEERAQGKYVTRPVQVGEIGGFPIMAITRVDIFASSKHEQKYLVEFSLQMAGNYNREIKVDISALGAVRSAESVISNLDANLRYYQDELKKADKFIADSETAADATFKGQPEIDELRQKIKNLETELAPPPPTPQQQANAQPGPDDPDAPQAMMGAPPEEAPLAKTEPAAPALTPEQYLRSEALAMRPQFERALSELISAMLGRSVTTRFPDQIATREAEEEKRIRESWGGRDADIVAQYIPLDRLIEIAMRDPSEWSRLPGRAFHEAWHGFWDLLADPRERSLITSETPRLREWLKGQYAKRGDEMGANPDAMAEEEIHAESFRYWSDDRSNGQDSSRGMHIGIRKFFQRLWALFERIRNYLRGLGFKRAEDIFSDLYEGRMRNRQPADYTDARAIERRAKEEYEAGREWRDLWNKAQEERTAARGRAREEGRRIEPQFTEDRGPPLSDVPQATMGGVPPGPAPRSRYREPSLAQRVARFWQSTFQPELVSTEAMAAEPLFARYRSGQAQEKDAIVKQSEEDWQHMNKRSDAANLDFMDKWERGVSTGDPVLDRIIADYKDLMTRKWAEDQRWGSTASYVEDYLPHIWRRPDAYREWFRQRTNQMGPTWFQKKRYYEFIQEGLAAGLELRYTNPIDLITHRLMSGVDMRQRMELLYKLRDEMALAATVREVGAPRAHALERAGWQIVNAPDRRMWLIAPDVQLLWKNGVEARGLWEKEGITGSSFRGWMALKNVWVPIKLALSAFHPLHVLHINQANSLARSWVEATRNRDPIEALKAAFEGISTIPTLAIPNYLQGRVGMRAWQKYPEDQTPEERVIVALMNDGGFSAQLSEQLRIKARRDFADAMARFLRNEAKLKHGITLPLGMARRAVEVLQSAIFEKWIPALKTSAYLNDAATLLRRHPEYLTDDINRRLALRAIAKSIDNRFGEMFYATLFWNRTVKDAGIASFLSLGWNFGGVREFAGAAIEMVTRPLGLITDAVPPLRRFSPSEERRIIRDATNKIPFAIFYVMTAMFLINALMSYLLSGEFPKGMDFIFARAGGTNPDGTPRRITNMFYTREVPMLQKHAEEHGGNWFKGVAAMVWNKMMFQPFVELLQNKTYWGVNVFDENAPFYKQAWQMAKHVFTEQTSPMSASGAKRALQTGGGKRDVALSFLGFPPAPAYVEKTAMQNRIAHLYKEHSAAAAKTPEEGEQSVKKMEARNAILLAKQRGDAAGLEKAKKDAREALVKEGIKPKAAQDWINNVGKTPGDVSMFARLPPQDQRALLEDASDEEFARYYSRSKGEVKNAFRERWNKIYSSRRATQPQGAGAAAQ